MPAVLRRARPEATASIEAGEHRDLTLPGYRVQHLVAQSSRFEVYQAWSAARSCPVVLKTGRAGAGPGAADRIRREGAALSGLAHPHLIKLYETHEHPQPVLVLEVITGPTLGQLFGIEGRLSVPEAAGMGRQVASALWYLHGRGLLHCDLKPANVLVEQNMAKVIDLSGARPPGSDGRRHGTQGYLSPEQARKAEVTAATDVWGLGLLLLEALADRAPFPKNCVQYRMDHGPLASPPPWRARRVPAEFRGLVDACCAFEPKDRPSLAEAIAVLDRWMPGPPTRA